MIWQRVPPESGAAVMGLGVMSVAGHLAGFPVLSAVLLVVAAVLWALLGAAFLARLVFDNERWRSEAGRPGALTGVAGTGVLGLALVLHGWCTGWIFLVLTALLWLGLMPRVLRGLATPTVGVSFLVCVGTQSLAVLAGQLAADARSPFLLAVCAISAAVGLALYVLVLIRFDFRQVARGAGDHWVAGGALAISTVAVAKLHSAVRELAAPAELATAVRAIGIALWAITMCWYVVLAVAELLAPRLRYDFRRWATVFPLGMTCTASFGTAAATGMVWMADAARLLLWPALLVLCLTAWGTIHHLTTPKPSP
ncbi:tellurite resistance/C4-dicarboxylate transporter family protein [Saccharopolyspora shandongensis]|uniref:tellurite resistance/C4-dicarboxylate transporter family protein n=1 Tax=Saccharopolyspora shandongensis TaxID=418495 RepID=UPI0034013755